MEPLTNLEFDFSEAIQGVRHDQRWDILKPELNVLFHSHASYPELARHMRTKYGFDVHEPAYKYRFKKWGWKRSVPARKKDDILDHAQQRALQGKRTASVSFGTTIVDPRKLKRHVAGTQYAAFNLSNFNGPPTLGLEKIGVHLPSGVRPFTMWGPSFGGASRSLSLTAPSPSSCDVLVNTPSDIEFKTPSDTYMSPGMSPPNHPSPFSTAILLQTPNKRAKLFSQGKLIELIQTMDESQQKILSGWLYQFWFFAFKSAKEWGPNHQLWNANNLGFADHQALQLTKGNGIERDALPSLTNQSTDPFMNIGPAPTDLCRWSIHLDGEALFENQVDIDTIESHTDMPHDWAQESLDKCLQDGLRDNRFSTFSTEEVPMNLSLVAEAAAGSPQVLFEEALSFSIMAQNYESFCDLLDGRKTMEAKNALKSTKAMHTATSYLSGGQACCNLLNVICLSLQLDMREVYTNDYGHTVLDNLMLTVLKSHSTAAIECIDDRLRKGTRYTGIEIDICGRWTADSPCFQSLIATGATSIPHHWKHKFCNTSVQAVCHCITILGVWCSPNQMMTSGLFQKLCTNCGTKLQPQSLHSVILVGYVLANNARPDEDLFGIVACFLCLLSQGVSPLDTAAISVSTLFEKDESSQDCTHEELTPYALLDRLSKLTHDPWPKDLQIGWSVLTNVCQRATYGPTNPQQSVSSDVTENEDEASPDEVRYDMESSFMLNCSHHDHDVFPEGDISFNIDPSLAHLWAATQAEFLNYRRLGEGGPWLSENFDVIEFAHAAKHEEMPQTGYCRKDTLGGYCPCGRFPDAKFRLPVRRTVSREGLYFSNMDCWERTSFVRNLSLVV